MRQDTGKETNIIEGFDFVQQVSELDEAQRLQCYESLAHNLTVSIRGVWSTGDIPDSEKVDRIKWINEILHRATRMITVLRTHEHEWPDKDFDNEIRHWISQNPAIDGTLGWAVKTSFKKAVSS